MEHILMILGPDRSSAKMIPLYYELQRLGVSTKIAAPAKIDPLIEHLFSFFSLQPHTIITDDSQKEALSEGSVKDINMLFDEIKPSLVLVEGENKTAATAALAAYFRKIPVAHVDAGIKRPQMIYPKTQKLLNLISSYHFTSTSAAAAHILAQGIQNDVVFSIGNLTRDLLKTVLKKIMSSETSISPETQEAFAYAQAQGYRRLLVSFNPASCKNSQLDELLDTLKELLALQTDLCIFFAGDPQHIVDSSQHTALYAHERFFVCPLKGYSDEVYALQACDMVLTDSATIQDEASCLSKPVLLMKSTTESVEGIWSGLTYLTSTNREKIINTCLMLEKKPKVELAKEGNIAQKVAEIIVRIVRQSQNKVKAQEFQL